jgi:hypothetical protein
MKKEVRKSNYDFTDNVVTVLLWYVNSVLTLLSLKKLDPIKQATRDSGNSLILSHHSACPHTRVLSSLAGLLLSTVVVQVLCYLWPSLL